MTRTYPPELAGEAENFLAHQNALETAREDLKLIDQAVAIVTQTPETELGSSEELDRLYRMLGDERRASERPTRFAPPDGHACSPRANYAADLTAVFTGNCFRRKDLPEKDAAALLVNSAISDMFLDREVGLRLIRDKTRYDGVYSLDPDYRKYCTKISGKVAGARQAERVTKWTKSPVGVAAGVVVAAAWLRRHGK